MRVARVASCAIVLTACGRPAAGPHLERSLAEIDGAVEAFFAAYEAGDADSVVSFFTTDAVLMPPGAQAVRGASALRRHVGAGIALGRWSQSAPTDTLVSFGDHALQVGRYSIRFERTASTPSELEAFEEEGRYMIHWQQVDGRWKMAHYIANRSAG